MKITKAIILGLLLMFGLTGLALGRDLRVSEPTDLNLSANNGEGPAASRPKRKHRRKHYRRGRRRHIRKHVM